MREPFKDTGPAAGAAALAAAQAGGEDMHRHGDTQVFRITGARAGLSDDVRVRQRRYVISMGIRTLCFLAAVFLWDVSRPLAWLALAGGLILPYVAVVVANAGRENAPGLPGTMIHTEGPPHLEEHTPSSPPRIPEEDHR